MGRWVRVASVGECPPGTARECVAEERIVAVFNVGGRLHALDGICPHQGGPLGRGALAGHMVTCPWHGWQFDVRTGQHAASPTRCHLVLPIRVLGDDVLVWLDDDEATGGRA
ncbi:MAG: Rieske 2Fe-2S domain-containing protein [Pirellulaceae bacterium]|jgi:nitrite reductase (NADH) small subunit|nr:Rieske 2Fe-2S domain-containing protein [Pirellulaceae bacterium]